MSSDNQIRAALREVPVTLVPSPSLADDVLSALNRQRRIRVIGATTVLFAVVAGIPVALTTFLDGPGNTIGTPAETPTPPSPNVKPSTVAPGVTAYPRPAGGQTALHLFVTDDRTYLLNPISGEYQDFPFGEAKLSPDLKSVAVAAADGRIGIADRASLLRDGVSALSWIDISGPGLAWSPDGKAVVVTEVDKATNQTSFAAKRYDIATQKITTTQLPAGIGGQAGWAADSRRYIVLLSRFGPLQYIEPDGSLGPRILTDGGFVEGATSYSPSRQLMIVDSSQLDTTTPVASRIMDVATGSVVSTTTGRPLGWYNDTHYIRAGAGSQLEIVDASTGMTFRVIEAGGLPTQAQTGLQFGTTEVLSTGAKALGF